MTKASTNANSKPSHSKKATKDKKTTVASIHYEEMERLMNVYGSIKALRNRGPKPSNKVEENEEGEGNGQLVKRESIKRKFYRWFPDLEERFVLNDDGKYHPINGHENEINYRKEMRNYSVVLVSSKRATALLRKKYKNGMLITDDVEVTIDLPAADELLPEFKSRGVPPPPTRKVKFGGEDIISSLVSEDEDDESSNVDHSFRASEAIFDEVNDEFFGQVEGSFSNENVEESLDAISISSSTVEDDLELWEGGLFDIRSF